MKYNHYSFDLWLTIIKSNKQFKKQRNYLIFSEYNSKQYDLSSVENVVRKYDVDANKTSEVTGIHVNVKIILFNILNQLNYTVTLEMVQKLEDDIQAMFLIFLPSFYDDDTLSSLTKLKQSGATLSILSNTGFITYSTLLAVFIRLGIVNLFSFELFSDKMGLSKPNPAVFSLLKAAVKIHYPEGAKIVHVGDNIFADGASVHSGIEYYQVNTNSNGLKTLLEYANI